MEKVTIFGNTDMGRIRTNNEDSFIIQNIWDGDHILAVVIDGVGGYEGGEVAAELARNSIVEYLEEYPNGERVDLLKQAVIDANNKIFAGRETLELENMSCVLTSIIVEVKQRRICMAHVGDTRLYQYAYGEITKLSHDHSLVGYREEIGELTEEQAMKHPQRNIIGRDVGSSFLENSGHDYVEVATFPLIERSTLMLCSDGLCDMLTSLQMSAVLEQKIPVEDKVAALIAAANDAGGRDNVTVVMVDVDLEELEAEHSESRVCVEQPCEEQPSDDELPSEAIDPKGGRRLRKWCIVVVVLLILFAAFAAGYYSGATKTEDRSSLSSPEIFIENSVGLVAPEPLQDTLTVGIIAPDSTQL